MGLLELVNLFMSRENYLVGKQGKMSLMFLMGGGYFWACCFALGKAEVASSQHCSGAVSAIQSHYL